MQRIKIPYGGMTPEQLEVMGELAEEYSDGIAHITTRQDFQLHFIHIEDTTTLMRRLGAAGITTREACGNSVRNVTTCPYAGVCPDEAFDVTPYAKALALFLLGHPDVQNFGRKFKTDFQRLRATCLRLDGHPRSRLYGQNACGRRPGETGLSVCRRRGTGRRASSGQGVRRVSSARGSFAGGSGHLTRLCPATARRRPAAERG